MNKETALTVKEGDSITLTDFSQTPGREQLRFPAFGKQELTVKNIKIDSAGCPHFDCGLGPLPNGAAPLKSRDDGKEIDGSNKYWMHPSRFDK